MSFTLPRTNWGETGSAIAVAIRAKSRLPTSAGATPPPAPKSTGPLVKKSQLSAPTPREKTDHTTIESATIATSAAAVADASATRLTSSRRGRLP